MNVPTETNFVPRRVRSSVAFDEESVFESDEEIIPTNIPRGDGMQVLLALVCLGIVGREPPPFVSHLELGMAGGEGVAEATQADGGRHRLWAADGREFLLG